LADSGLTLEVDLPDEPLLICGDPARIQQIQVNLLVNAIKYTPAGGRIWLSARRNGDRAVLRVRDTGIGIPPEMREKIFDLFVQVDDTPGKTDGGMGVGLTLVKTLVELHGGELSVHSEGEGRGSEFVVRLPLAESSHANFASCEPSDDSVDLAGLRVLLVEDHADIRLVTSRLLAAAGCEVTQAANGDQGVNAIVRDRPKVALIDIGLPDVNGYDVARKIRQLPEGRDVTLLALTGFGQPDDRQKALDAGFDEHLVKPLDYQELISVIRGSIGNEIAGGEARQSRID
jgi:CheY-like chemotaxis protein